MIRKNTSGDISDEEFEKVLRPFYDNYHCYVEEYVMLEVIAFYSRCLGSFPEHFVALFGY